MLVLNERLSNFIKVYEILNQTQIGFQKKRRTVDHVFTLKTITNKYLSAAPKGKLYTCFVDLRKAYGSVWHEGLFAKLKYLNIDGQFLQLISDIYLKAAYAFKIRNQRTSEFIL